MSVETAPAPQPNLEQPLLEAESLWHNPLAPELRAPVTIEAYETLTCSEAVESYARQIAHDENRRYRWERHGSMSFAVDEVPQLTGELINHALRHDSGFVSEDDFNLAIDKTARVIEIDARKEPLEFPLSSVVSAIGFKSWEEGRGSNSSKGGRTSRDVIQDYASRETEIPPFEEAKALILPTGEVALMSGSAHSAAAAKLKGQATIKVKNLTVFRASDFTRR